MPLRFFLGLVAAAALGAVGGAHQASADGYPQMACNADTFISSNSSEQAQQLLPAALQYCAEYNQVMDLLNQAASSGCLSDSDLSTLDSLVAKTSAFERADGSIFVTELDSWYETTAQAVTSCGGGSGGMTPLSMGIAAGAAVVVLGGISLALRSNRRRALAGVGVSGAGWSSAPPAPSRLQGPGITQPPPSVTGLQGPGIPQPPPPTTGLQGPGITQPPPSTAGLQGPGIPQPNLPPFIGQVPSGAPLGGAGASFAAPEMPAVRDLQLVWRLDGRPTLSWQPPQLDPSRWQLQGYTLYQYQYTGMSTLPQPAPIGNLPPGASMTTVNWTSASQTYTFSTGGDVAGWGVQPVFQATGGQFAGTTITGPLSWIPTGL
ncbi:MAG TPA: hypothetical protein VEK76_10275 [Candidatus Binatia bacterium]|nr:hypothetical protein [Candidatus Binatia bacterium]